jgi:hypothetical protein
MQAHGRCHCGQITYTADLDPGDVSICHCTDCQMLTGSAYRVSVRASAAGFRMQSGQPSRYSKTAESGNKRAHWFCPNCGTPTYSCAVENPPSYTLRIRCLDERALLPPRRQIWCQSAVPWSENIAGVEKFDRH